MKSNAIAKFSDGPILEQLSGDDKGQTYALSGDRISIGRSDNNDIIVVGEAVSRYHASIEKSPDGGFVIQDQNSKNGVQVNGVTVNEVSLKDGDLVQIGVFMFRFRAPVGSELPEASGDSADQGIYSEAMAGVSKGGKEKNRRILIYGILGVVLVGVYFMNGDTPAKVEKKDTPGLNLPEITPPPPLKATDTSSKVTGLEDPLLANGTEEERAQKTKELKDAEQYFKKGLREYTSENYHRSIELFRTALTLNRRHELASYYLGLASFEIEKLANKNFEIGRKYFEAMHYSRSMYHFNEVIQLLQHRPTDKRVKDAERFLGEAKKRLQEAQQFP